MLQITNEMYFFFLSSFSKIDFNCALRKYVSAAAVCDVQPPSSTVSLCSFELHHSGAVTAGTRTALHVTYGEMITNYCASCLANSPLLIQTRGSTHADVSQRAFQHVHDSEVAAGGWQRCVAKFNLNMPCCNRRLAGLIHLCCQQRRSKDKSCLLYKDISLSQHRGRVCASVTGINDMQT